MREGPPPVEVAALLDALGDEGCRALEREDTEDLMVLPEERGGAVVYAQYRLSQGVWEPLPERTRAQVERVLSIGAGMRGRCVRRRLPALEVALPWGLGRLTGAVPEMSPLGPTFIIRKHAAVSPTLDWYAETGAATLAQVRALRERVGRRNIVIVGEVGSGKSTLLAACTSEPVFAGRHGVFVEDLEELRLPDHGPGSPKTLYLADHPETGMDMRAVLRASLRRRPSYTVIGEMRGPEAMDVMAIWRTTRGGLTTMHLSDDDEARDAVERVCDLIAQNAGVVANVREVCRLLHVVVQVVALPDGQRRIVGPWDVRYRDGAPVLEPAIGESVG